MKEFIYLDTNYLTSALAQINEGNIISFTGESTDTSQTSNTSSDNKESKSEFGINTPLKVNFGGNNSTYEENSLLDISSAKEIITKTFDDYAYNILLNHIKSTNKLKINDCSDGDFALIKGKYELIDLNFIDTLLGDDFIDMYVQGDLAKEKFDTSQNNYKNAQNKLEKTRKAFYSDIRKKMNTFQKVMPSDTLLIINNVIAPINSKFLRGNYKDISFKYDDINVLVRITRTYKKQQYSNAKILLNAIDHMMPSLLQLFNIDLNDSSLIATPIAIYIE